MPKPMYDIDEEFNRGLRRILGDREIIKESFPTVKTCEKCGWTRSIPKALGFPSVYTEGLDTGCPKCVTEPFLF